LEDLLTSDPFRHSTCTHSEVPADIRADVFLS